MINSQRVVDVCGLQWLKCNGIVRDGILYG